MAPARRRPRRRAVGRLVRGVLLPGAGHAPGRPPASPPPGGLCASPSCGRPFVHVGGGSPRRYCTPRCATRERVAAHRTRSADAVR
ncbi:CGNR zinc finger domain-containing protein [Saccharomonospora glauca]|uniref:CGNR zinc finger domain-containing protein n=1 Tax=Saccharomonospora glauca TaxID=40990 RepID=UPI002FC2AA2C